MGRMSVATVKSPEFINISSISPFASKCEIKVLYLGQNRNGSFIDKQVAETMAQTLPGCPIVGYYSEDKRIALRVGDRESLQECCRCYGWIGYNHHRYD